MSNQIRNSGKTNNEMSALITKLGSSDTRKTVHDSAIVADEILEDMNQVEKETADVNGNVNKLRAMLAVLDPSWESKFGKAEEDIAKSLINIRDTNNLWNANEANFKQQNDNFQKKNDSISSKLQELRDKIAQAKHAAEGVSLIDSTFPSNFKFKIIFRSESHLSRKEKTAFVHISQHPWDHRLRTTSS